MRFRSNFVNYSAYGSKFLSLSGRDLSKSNSRMSVSIFLLILILEIDSAQMMHRKKLQLGTKRN